LVTREIDRAVHRRRELAYSEKRHSRLAPRECNQEFSWTSHDIGERLPCAAEITIFLDLRSAGRRRYFFHVAVENMSMTIERSQLRFLFTFSAPGAPASSRSRAQCGAR
jgi:hypothetical protein